VHASGGGEVDGEGERLLSRLHAERGA